MLLDVDRSSTDADLTDAVTAWVDQHVPESWREASARGRAAIREVRPLADYEAWYPTFAESGLAVATWPRQYLGLDLRPSQARVLDSVLSPFNLGRLNPLGLNNAAPALFAYGTEEQRLRYLPPIVRNEEKWCQLFSEPGAGSDLASLATRAVRDGDVWVLTGQKVWTTWAHQSRFGLCLARTDPQAPKRNGLTYFIVDLEDPRVEVRELRHIGGEVDFNEVWLDGVEIPDTDRLGAVGEGWRAANATLAGERQMVAGAGSGGVDRIGGSGADRLIRTAKASGQWDDPLMRQRLTSLYSEESVRRWTNERVRATVKAGGTPGPAASIGKVHQGALNQRIQLAATDLLGAGALAWEVDVAPTDPESWARGLPYEVKGMLRSRANTIEGGTTEVNKNVLGEKVLGLPREPDPYHELSWEATPRS
ncbi:MAG: acyl-CoA dehydrogenase protein [Ilumatobacteraceae bacterium]|nr:acyl-CoA dehydrogenase protein [Ilumatobacteraceae bacterium]